MDLKSRKMKILAAVVMAIIAVVAFRIYSNIQSEKERAARLSRSQAVAVSLGRPERRSIVPELEFSGSLDPQWQAEVAAKVNGRVEKGYVKEGDRVTKGQVLAVLEQTDTDADVLAARGTYMDAQTNLRKAETDLARYAKLYAEGAVSQQVVDDYRFVRDNARAKLNSALGTLQGMESKAAGTAVAAPADGIVYKRYYQEGYYATAGTPLFAIADISMLKSIINIPEGQIDGIAVGNEAEIMLTSFGNRKITGRITRISPVADLPAHTFEAEVSVDNPQGLLAGVFATVRLTAQPKNNVLTIPVYAIVMRDDQKTVFVADEKGIVTRKVITVGYTDDKIAEVLDGLQGDEIIVTGGQNKLREGSKVDLSKAGN